MADDPQEDRDEELWRAVRDAAEGDLRAFEKLIERHQRRILADCRHLTRDENNSEDLAQEVFVKAFFGLRTFDGRSSFRHWLQRIKVHHCLNHLKKHQGKEDRTIDEETVEKYEGLHTPAAHQEGVVDGNRLRVNDILTSMPEKLRIPLIMSDMDELSNEEIAVGLGIGLSAVKMRIKRGREYFRRRYMDEDTTGRERALK